MGNKATYDWASVDWTRDIKDIAASLGCSVNTAYLRRSQLTQRDHSTGRPLVHEWNRIDWRRSTKDIADELMLPIKQVGEARRIWATDELKTLRVWHAKDWESVDWSLPPETIAKSLGCHVMTVYRHRRNRA